MTPPSDHDSDGYGIALQPVCDSELRHVADKLLYRESPLANRANVQDAILATSRSSATALFEIGLQDLVGDRSLLCAIPKQWVLEPDLILYPPEQIILEIPQGEFSSTRCWAAVRELQNRGYRIALDREIVCRPEINTLSQVDVVKTDFRRHQTPLVLPAWGEAPPIQLAGFLETSDQLDQARKAGFDWLQGFVFSLPVMVKRAARRRSGNRVVEIQLLAMLADENLEFHDLEPLVAQHPSLATRLLRQVNSAAFARLRTPINTLSEALVRLGTQNIRMLISSFIISSDDPIRSFQARELLIRAAMASNVAERVASVSPSVAFSVGLFSELHLFEGQSMDELVQDLPFSDEIQSALLKREGELGKLLRILDAFQSAELQGLADHTISMLNEDYLRAVTWADSWLRTSDS